MAMAAQTKVTLRWLLRPGPPVLPGGREAAKETSRRSTFGGGGPVGSIEASSKVEGRPAPAAPEATPRAAGESQLAGRR